MKLSITHSTRVALAIGAAALTLGACGGDDSEDQGSANASASAMDGGIVSVASVDDTDVLVDSESRTLYTAAVEKGKRVLCKDGCTSIWAPVIASASEAKSASADLDVTLGVVKRPDGSEQLTFEGLPLYSFTEEGPDQLEGDGVVDDFQGTNFEWQAATTGGESPSSNPDASNDGPSGY